jgi:hypothetical protein
MSYGCDTLYYLISTNKRHCSVSIQDSNGSASKSNEDRFHYFMLLVIIINITVNCQQPHFVVKTFPMLYFPIHTYHS